MNRACAAVLLCLTGLSLAGCANSMRGYLEKDTPNETLTARQDLTMPPDLRLPPPGTTAAAPDPGVATPAATEAASGPDAIYTNVGISVFNPDGTRKTDQQLREELQAYYIAQKKARNPNYGTFMNIGNIFKDE